MRKGNRFHTSPFCTLRNSWSGPKSHRTADKRVGHYSCGKGDLLLPQNWHRIGTGCYLPQFWWYSPSHCQTRQGKDCAGGCLCREQTRTQHTSTDECSLPHQRWKSLNWNTQWQRYPFQACSTEKLRLWELFCATSFSGTQRNRQRQPLGRTAQYPEAPASRTAAHIWNGLETDACLD